VIHAAFSGGNSFALLAATTFARYRVSAYSTRLARIHRVGASVAISWPTSCSCLRVVVEFCGDGFALWWVSSWPSAYNAIMLARDRLDVPYEFGPAALLAFSLATSGVPHSGVDFAEPLTHLTQLDPTHQRIDWSVCI
jgi:hypothetical protein